MHYFRVAVFLLLLSVIQVVLAETNTNTHPGRDDVRINVTHGDRPVVHVTENDAPTRVKNRVLRDDLVKNEILVPHDSDVTVVITNPNPILFTYEVKDFKQEQTASAEALDDFGETLKLLAGGLKQLVPGAAEAAGLSDAPQCNPDGLTQIKLTAKFVSDKAADVPTKIVTSLTDPVGVRADVGRWKVADEQKKFETAYSALSDEALQILASSDSSNDCAGLVALALAKVSDIREALAKLKRFEDLARKLDVPVELKTFTVDRSQFTTFKLAVDKTDLFPKTLTTTRFIGDVTIKVSPDEKVRVAPLAGAVYSWVESAEYAAVATGEKFKIQETDSDTTGFALEAGVEFAPRSWDFGGFDGVIQLGVAPKDDLGIFLGLGLKTGKYSFGAGLAMHQVNVLSGGLSVGQEIATKDDLKTDKEFKSGPYVFFSFKP